MKKERRLVLHAVTVIAIFIFGFLALGSGSTPKPKAEGETTIDSSVTGPIEFKYYMIPGPERKAFTTMGLVFASSQSKFDENNKEIASQEYVGMLLLREAHKLGADDILNLRIEENITWFATVDEVNKRKDGKPNIVYTRTVTYTGSALAIKYNDNPIKDPQMGALPR
jgi:hypothetical protein